MRAQFQTREFEERFIAIGLNYQIIGGFRFYERAEIRDSIAYLRLIVQPADDLAFERIVNTPKRGLGDKAVATIHRHARATQQPLLIAAASLLDSDELTPQARRSLGNFVADLARWLDDFEALIPSLLRDDGPIFVELMIDQDSLGPRSYKDMYRKERRAAFRQALQENPRQNG